MPDDTNRRSLSRARGFDERAIPHSIRACHANRFGSRSTGEYSSDQLHGYRRPFCRLGAAHKQLD